MNWSVLLTLLMLPALSLGATFDVNWVLGVSETLDVAVGDTINFNWGQTISHNVDWTPVLFPTSGTTSDSSNVETYTVPSSAAGNDYLVICTIHPSMQVNVRVQSDENSTSAPTDFPTPLPTRSPVGTNETHTPTVSPTDAPSSTPTKSPTQKPTPFPTIVVVTSSTDSGGDMTTTVIVGIIIASVAAIAATGIGAWSYWRYRNSPEPRPMRIQSSARRRDF
jgi:hypothetical protein